VRGLIRFFIENYVLAISLFGALTLFGVVSALGLGVDLLPEIDIPVVAVSTTYPGAGPAEVSRGIAEPIEGQLSTLPGISAVTSIASEGFGVVIAQFDAGVNVNEAAIDVSGRVNAIAPLLPEGAGTPAVQKFDPADEPILSVAVAAPGEALSAVQAFAEDELQPALRRVPGVADVTVVGPAAREIQVLLNPAQLAAYGLTPQAVAGAIAASATDVAAGTLTVGDNRLLLAGRATPENLEAVAAIRVDSAQGVRVGDVATVRDGTQEVTTYARLDGEPVVLLEVRKLAGSNTVATADNLRETLSTFALPPDYRASVVGDTSVYIASSVRDTLRELLIAAFAVSLIVLLFTGRLGSVFGVVLAIPISAAGTFIVFGLLGFSFNLITLLAITVAIGLVVDDSIVVAENMDRYRAAGLSRREAVLKGTGEVATAVLAATLSLLAVFLPISFLPGVVGQFFSQFGITLAAAIAFSYLEAMLFLTVRLALAPDPLPPGWRALGGAVRRFQADAAWSAGLLRRAPFWGLLVAAGALLFWRWGAAALALPLALPPSLFLLRYLGRLLLLLLGALLLSLHRATNLLVDWGRRAYVRSLRAALGHAWAVLLLAAALFGSLFVVFPQIGFNFQPPDDSGLVGVTLELPAGTSLERTNVLASELERALLADPVVETVQVTVGTGGILGGSNAERARFTLQLVPKRERPLSTTAYIVALEDTLGELLRGTPEAEVAVANAGAGGPPGSSGYTLNLASNDLELLRERTEAALAVLRDTEGLRGATSDLAETTTERVFVVNPAALDGTGLTVSDIFNTLSAYNVGNEAGRLRAGGDEVPIRVRADPRFLGDEGSLLGLPVLAPASGSALPLGQLGSFETRAAPAAITRVNQAYNATLSAELSPGASLSQIQARVEAQLTAEGILDNRVVQQQGANFDLLGDLLFYAPIAFALALLLNYLAIGSQFNSFKYPLYLLLTVPLALVGVIWLFYLSGTSLDVISVLGVVMLVGLVTKNAILLLDVALARAGSGLSLQEALLEAASVRFRPILMTTTTVVVISLPLMLGLGEGAEFRYPLGLVILGGVMTSALLTFYVVPAAFYQFERRAYDKDLPQAGSGGAGAVTSARPPKEPATTQPALNKLP
jgi:HAE1 family hydrophobic/amphiphilic exporter-1